MAAYLLLWNPAKYDWPDLGQLLNRLDHGEPAFHPWGVGNRVDLEPGSTVYLMQTGDKSPGIRARGLSVTRPRRGPRIDGGGERNHMQVQVQFLDLQDRDEVPSVPRELLQHDPVLGDINWCPQRGGMELPPIAAPRLALLWREMFHHRQDQHGLMLDSRDYEGEILVRLARHRRRERALRAKRLAMSASIHGYQLICEVCDMNMTKRFEGSVGHIAEVHHTRPLAEYEHPQPTHINDLAVVCPTCHRFIHSRQPIYTIEQAREKMSLGKTINQPLTTATNRSNG
ncbi:MAG: HNH endonuclease [Dehalococcoidia bacterium]